MSPSDSAELSTLNAQIDDILARVVVIAERYDTPDSALAAACFAAERALASARRSLNQAGALLEERPPRSDRPR